VSGASAAAAIARPAVRTAVPACDRAYCLHLRDGTTACACLATFLAYADSGTLTLTLPDRRAFSWHVEVQIYRDTAEIEALHTDLDGDGVADFVIATLAGVGNGLAMEDWNVAVIDGRGRHPPALVATDTYNTPGSWVRIAGRSGCLLLYTYWQQLDLDPRRGPGTYLTGKLWPFREGQLDTVLLPQMRARRLLNSFSFQRGADSYHRSRPWPLRWFQDSRANSMRSLMRTPMEPDTLAITRR
jgi:hypothetical protein